ncbi:MAG: site-specific integrase [Acidobacteria bacterium]|nr:site-specific integrase [Acidobacteriota bacterium]
MARPGGRDRGIFFRPHRHGEVVGPKGRRGEWWTRWYDAEGKEHREKAGTKSMALDLYRRRKTEVRQGRHFPESLRQRDLRLKDLVDDYLEAVKASQVKTARLIERRLAEVLGLLGPVAAKAVKAEDLERLKLKLLKGTRKTTRRPASVNRYLQDLRAVFIRAVEAGKLDRSPFLGVDLLDENNKRTRELTPDEEARLFLALPADPPALRPYFRFLLETGARAGEACGLTWGRIQWADGMAELPETKAGHKQHLTLSKAALAILRDLPRNGPHVFCWPDGEPFTVGYTTKAFLRAARRAKLGDLRQHDLRHTFAIRRLRGGANLVAVSGLLRHSSTRMSERYLHVTRADLRAAVEAGQPSPTGTPTGTEIEAMLQAVNSEGAA